MTELNQLLEQDVWTGSAKEKCVQIQSLLMEYCNKMFHGRGN